MRIVLCYPPDRTIPSMAYSSLSVLATAMRAKGHEVKLLDLNLETADLLIQRDRLAAFRDFVEGEFAALEARDRIPATEKWRYELFGMLMATPRDSLLAAEEGKAIMRDPDRFFEPPEFNRAFNDLSAALRLLYAGTPLLYPENPTYVKDLKGFLDSGPTDPVMEAYRNEIRDDVLAFEPDIVGFTLPFHQQFVEALKFAKAIKEVRPETYTVLGGTSVVDYEKIYFADDTLAGIIDFAVKNDGENALDRLARAVGGEIPIEDVPNLIRFERGADGGATLRHEVEPELQNLNDALTPDFEGLPLNRYMMPFAVANMCTSRGCYYGKCAFCGDAFKRDYRMRKPERVYDDVKTIHRDHGIKYFYFWDSLAPPRTLRHLSREIHREGLDIRWFAETRLEKTYASLETQQEMFRGGCRMLQFGYESGNQRVLDLMRKGNKLPVVKEIFENMRISGLGASCSWFIGFPTETEDEAWDTYRFLHRYRDVVALSVYTGTFMIGGDTHVALNPDRYDIEVEMGGDGGLKWRHKGDFTPWDLTSYNEAFTVRTDILLLNHGCFVLYHAERPGTVLGITGCGRMGRLAREIEDLPNMRPFIPPGNRIQDYRFDPIRSEGDLVPGNAPYHQAYVARSGWVFGADSLTKAIFEQADGKTSFAEMAEKLGSPLEDVLDHARTMIDRGIVAENSDRCYFSQCEK